MRTDRKARGKGQFWVISRARRSCFSLPRKRQGCLPIPALELAPPKCLRRRFQDDDVAWFESHHVGSISRSNSAKSIVDTEKRCRLERGVTERRCDRHTQQINAITNRACHPEGGAGERAVVAY